VTELVFATRNRGKLRELEALVAPLGYAVRSLADVTDAEVVEDAPTFVGNAEKKARAALAASGLPAIGDDSGLEVDALGGAPGVLSARWAGAAHDDGANNRKLLEALAGVPATARTARFRCVLVYLEPDGGRLVAEGACEGRILEAPRGAGGFGYDPLFEVAGQGRSMAELSLEEKNRISHRAQALGQLAHALARRRGIS
jgi:XTP/dITP diphosphohydrolase